MVLEESDREGWIALSYSLVVTALVAFAAYAIIYTRFFSDKGVSESTTGFITARNSQGMWRIAWSFYAGSVGAWCIATPSNHATYAGWVGLVSYAIACGLPVHLVAILGTTMKRKWPEVNSLGDYVMTRFGPTARLLTIVVALFNMAIFMIVEFTTIGALFQDFVGSLNYPIIIVVGVLTTAYTAYGGLLVSIVTDQVQGIFSAVLLVMVAVVVATTFDAELPSGFGDYADRLGPNASGYSSAFTLPLCLLSSGSFNEGTWQRVWAAKDERALRGGAMIASLFTVMATFTFGIFGYLAAWGGLVDFDTANINLYMFQVFSDSSEPAKLNQWVHVVILVLAATMHQSAIDSAMNGMAATLSSHFLKREPIAYARFCVVLISIPVALVALQNLNIIQLFLTGNMLAICCMVPLWVGVYWDSPTGRRVVSETTYVCSSVTSVLATIVYGTWDQWTGDLGASISAGAKYGWIDQPYDWDYLLLTLCTSVASSVLYGALAELLHRYGIEGYSISRLLAPVPGFHALVQDSAEGGVGPIHRACMACLGRSVDPEPSEPAAERGVDVEKAQIATGPAVQRAQPESEHDTIAMLPSSDSSSSAGYPNVVLQPPYGVFPVYVPSSSLGNTDQFGLTAPHPSIGPLRVASDSTGASEHGRGTDSV